MPDVEDGGEVGVDDARDAGEADAVEVDAALVGKDEDAERVQGERVLLVLVLLVANGCPCRVLSSLL